MGQIKYVGSQSNEIYAKYFSPGGFSALENIDTQRQLFFSCCAALVCVVTTQVRNYKKLSYFARLALMTTAFTLIAIILDAFVRVYFEVN